MNGSSLGIGYFLEWIKNAAGKRKYVLNSFYFLDLDWYIFVCSRLLLLWTIKVRIFKN